MKETESMSYTIEKLNADSIISNNKAIRSLSKTLSDNTNWRGSSDNYENVVKALNELAEYSKDMLKPSADQMNRYLELANEADKLMSKYLKEKKLNFFSSSYAHNRVNTMKEIQAKIKENIASMKERQMEVDAEEARNFSVIEDNKSKLEADKIDRVEARNQFYKIHDKYGLSMNENKAIYHGENFTEESVLHAKHGALKVDRTGPYSLASLALAAAKDENGNYKYTFDDIMDPTKLHKEKADMFKRVMDLYAATDDPETKKSTKEPGATEVAKLMHEGIKRGSEVINEQLSNMNFSNPETFKSEQYVKLATFSEAMFDVSQEVAAVEKQVLKVSKEDGYNFKNISEYQSHTQVLTGVLADIGNSMIHLKMNEKKYQDKLASGKTTESDLAEMIVYGAKIKIFEDVLKEYDKEARGKETFTEWYRNSGWAENYDNVSAGIKGEIVAHYSKLYENAQKATEIGKNIHDDVITGEYFNTIKYNKFSDPHPGLKNLQSTSEFATHKDIENPEIVRESFVNKYNELEAKKKDASEEEIGIITKAQESLSNLTDRMLLDENVDDNNRDQIIKDVTNVMKADMIDSLKAEGVEPAQLNQAIDGALKEYNFVADMNGLKMADAYYYSFKTGNKDLIDNNLYMIEAGKKAAEVNVKYNEKKANVETKKKQLEQEVAVSSAEAVARMENYAAGTYKNEKEFFKDAATIVTGIIYNETGRLPKSKTTGKTYTLEEYADLLAKSDSFKNSFRKEDGRLRNPKAVVRTLSDPQSVKEILSSAGKTVNQTRQRSKSVHVRKQTKNTKKQEVKRPSV